MPITNFANILLLKGLKLENWSFRPTKNLFRFWVKKKSTSEVCPKCATLCSKIYDHRRVDIKDEPIRDKAVVLHLSKRRFFCKNCNRPFTEPVKGIKKGCRTTERFRESVFVACERYGDLKTVRKSMRCSGSFLYKTLYQRLERKSREQPRRWPTSLGIDEHFFKRKPIVGGREFVTVIANLNKHKLVEVVEGRQGALLRAQLAGIPGREQVNNVVMDLSGSYRAFAQEFFPNAKITADKFHVIRLLNPAINRHRKAIMDCKNGLQVRCLLLTNGVKLDYVKKHALYKWLGQYPALKEIYFFKEALHCLYRTKNLDKARCSLINTMDEMAKSQVPEVRSLRKTLLKWQKEILAYFETRLTNATTEGFNCKAKLIKRRAYGYRSFKNYRLRLLTACC